MNSSYANKIIPQGLIPKNVPKNRNYYFRNLAITFHYFESGFGSYVYLQCGNFSFEYALIFLYYISLLCLHWYQHRHSLVKSDTKT